ncbi:MAG: hypothetical protein SH847_11020 [Roseiflexaceae bacterium]|nr:hypothetical protein [Roseiflexaceae bacterium]
MRYRVLGFMMLLVLVIAAVPVSAQDGRVADLNIRLWPTPSTAARGDIIRYDITLENDGDGKASRTNVTLPLPKGQFSLVKIELSQKTSWVMEVADEKIVIMFGTLRRGEIRDARVFLKLNNAPGLDNAPMRIRASVNYDEHSGSRVRSNETTLTIAGATPDTTPAVSVEPIAGPAGTVFRFTVRNYFPKEKLFTWLNAPNAVLPSGLADLASEQGETSFDLETAKLKLAPGKYSFVVLGDSSKITTITPFEVK